MDDRHRQQIANRIHLALMLELGQGIDVRRMLASALYARDVLLVCRAFPGSELQRLGEQFAMASHRAGARPDARPDTGPCGSPGFGPSWRAACSEGFGLDDFTDARPEARQATRRWLAPSTWFAR